MSASHPVSKRTAAKTARRRSASAKLPDNGATSAERFFVEVVSQGAAEGSLDDKKLQLTRRVLFLARRWRNLMDEALRDTGDSHARWTTLLWVDLLKGRANHRELAERVGVELPTLIRLLNRLEREGVVERRALPGSAQSKTVVLTRLGRAQFKRMGAVVLATRAEFLRDVDEAQLTAALTLLDSLLNKYVRVVKWSDWK